MKLSKRQNHILGLLKQFKAMYGIHIADKLHVTPGQIHHIVNPMIKEGLIVKFKSNGYTKYCTPEHRPEIQRENPSGRKATHKGHCQICGRMHKVNVKTGRLANHGYTKAMGFFSGSCFGAEELPLEKSRNRILEAVRDAESQVERLLKNIAELDDPNNRTVFVDIRVPKKGYARCKATLVKRDGIYYAVAEQNTPHREKYPEGQEVDRWLQSGKDWHEMTQVLNRSYVANVQSHIHQINDHVRVLERRHETWKPRELTPVTE